MELKKRLANADKDFRDELQTLHKQINHQEKELIESKDSLQKCTQDLKAKTDNIAELQLHKERLMFYITELQKRYKDQKEKKEELKKSSVEKSNDEKIVEESESSEMESLNAVLNSHEFEPHTGLAQIRTVENHQQNGITENRIRTQGPFNHTRENVT